MPVPGQPPAPLASQSDHWPFFSDPRPSKLSHAKPGSRDNTVAHEGLGPVGHGFPTRSCHSRASGEAVLSNRNEPSSPVALRKTTAAEASRGRRTSP